MRRNGLIDWRRWEREGAQQAAVREQESGLKVEEAKITVQECSAPFSGRGIRVKDGMSCFDL